MLDHLVTREQMWRQLAVDQPHSVRHLSDMKTFNVRELSRSTAEVLDACEHDGGAIIQYQDGRQFELVPRGRRDARSRELPDFAARQRAVFGNRKFCKAQIAASLEAARGRQ